MGISPISMNAQKIRNTVIRPSFRIAADYMTNPKTPYSAEGYLESIAKLVQPPVLEHVNTHVIEEIASAVKKGGQGSPIKVLSDLIIAAIMVTNQNVAIHAAVLAAYPSAAHASVATAQLIGDTDSKLATIRDRLFALKSKHVQRALALA